VTQNQETVEYEAQTNSGQTVEDSSGHSDPERQKTVHCKVLTGSGQTVEDSSGHSDTEQTSGIV